MKKKLFLFVFMGIFLFSGCSDDDSAGVIVPEGEKVCVVGDNLYYNEAQLGATLRYWVELENAAQSDNGDHVVWSVNGTEVGRGTRIEYTPTVAGDYVVKYTVESDYSHSGASLTREVAAKAYSSKGILILNEPNMSASEETRGVNSFLYGGTTVERFIQGNYQQFGATNQFIANWAGKIYNIAPYTQQGVAFSQFKEDGTFVKAIATTPDGAMGRAFVGIDKKQGVWTTANNAFLVNLEDFTVNETPLRASANAANVFVTDGYVFLIANGNVLAYKATSLSSTTNPVILGNGTAGFVQSKDGYVWAANGGEFLKINPKDLSSEIVPIPDGVQFKFSKSPWKQCSFVASTKENALFFTNDGGWATASAVYKYDIEQKSLNKEFIVADKFENYMLYSTCLHYDTEQDELVLSAIKGYGSDGSKDGLFFFDAKTGTKKSMVLYETTPSTSMDMWFPAMIVPMKN